MPTSQVFGTSGKYVKYKIEVNVNSQNIWQNKSNITVKVFFYRSNQGYSTYGSGSCYCVIDGTSYYQTVSPSQKITSSGIYLFEKSVDITHENDGNKSIWISAYISMNTPLTSSNQGFTVTLPRIPRAAVYNNADDFYDTENPNIYFNNPAGYKLQLKMEAGGDDHLIVRDNVSANGSYTFYLSENERNILRRLCPNSNKLSVRFTVATYMPGSDSANNWSYGDKIMTIVDANPIFSSSNISYRDTNNVTTGITNNNQLIVRNKSNLEVTFDSATAQKYATISKYQTIFNGVVRDRNSAGTYTFGEIDSSKDLTLQVVAIDSRGNSTTVSKEIKIADWIAPIVNVTARRINNFENETNLNANVQISSVNDSNAIERIEYRFKKSDDSTWGQWFNLPNSEGTQVVLDNMCAWDIQFSVSDKFGTSVQSIVVPKGIPIMYFDTKKLSVGINCFPKQSESLEVNGKTIFDMVYPIGAIYFSAENVNPRENFGGTWTAWEEGRIPNCYMWKRTE